MMKIPKCRPGHTVAARVHGHRKQHIPPWTAWRDGEEEAEVVACTEVVFMDEWLTTGVHVKLQWVTASL